MGFAASLLRRWIATAAVGVFFTLAALMAQGMPASAADVATGVPPQPQADSVHVVAAGDIGTTADAASVLDRIAQLAPDAAFAVGDLSYNNAPESDWCAFVTSHLGAGLPFELVSGNHESDGLNGSIGNFASCLPNKLQGMVGTYGREYYVDLPAGKPVMRVINTSAGLHFPGGTWDYAEGDAHYAWTAAAIDSARASGINWVMVNNHYPCLGVAAYACVMPPDFYDLLLDRRVDLVVDGHDHAYMRTHQLAGSHDGCARVPTIGYDPDCDADADNAYTAGRGTVFATVGTGGRALRPVNLADPDLPNFAAWSGANANPSYGVLDVVATGDQLTATFKAAGAGAFADAFTISRPPAPQPPSAASVFVPVAPARVLDTRAANGGSGPLSAAEQRVLSVAAEQAGGAPVVPAGAVAVAVNLTVPDPAARGHVRLMPGDAARLTQASAVNFRARESIANGLTARIAPDRTLKLYNGAGGPVDAVVDVVGYFVPVPSATPQQLSEGLFTPLASPTRVYDSAEAGGPTAAGGSTLVDVSPAVPADSSAVAYNITVVGPAAAGHLRVYRAGSALPDASTVNFAVADRVANGTVVQLGADRRITVYNASAAPVRFLVDVVGYYGPTGSAFRATDPTRVLDTRASNGGAGPLGPGADAIFPISTAQADPAATAVPAGATAAEYNATEVAAGGAGHLRLWPGEQNRPSASVLNWPRAGYTRANASVVGLGPARTVGIYNGSGSTLEALVDVNGFYQPS